MGLEILSLEPDLATQTILDTQGEASENTVSRDVVARMFDDFDGISYEELGVLCAADG
jgi:hypothetical protein